MGRQSLTLSFNGEKIGAHAVDGPYRVADLSIQGSEALLLRSMVTETAGYAFTAFQGASGPPGPGTPPQINSGSIVDAAAFQPTVSAGGIASLVGLNLAADVNAASSIPLPTDLSGVRVRVDDIAAPLFFVSPAQVNFQIPVEAPSSGDADVVVVRNGLNSPPQTAPFAPAAPAVFVDSNTRQAIALTNPEGVLVTAQNPAASGDILTVFLTGLGPVEPPVGTGQPATGVSSAELPVSATIGGAEADVFFAGLAPGFVGLNQVNLRVPELSAAGTQPPIAVQQATAVPLVIRAGDAASPGGRSRGGAWRSVAGQLRCAGCLG